MEQTDTCYYKLTDKNIKSEKNYRKLARTEIEVGQGKTPSPSKQTVRKQETYDRAYETA